MAKPEGKNIAVLATNGFDDDEFNSPIKTVLNEGAKVTVVSPNGDEIESKKGAKASADASTEDSRSTNFDGIILPGGTGNADKLRMDEAAIEIVKKHVEAGKPLAVICHGAWILTDADVLRGRTLTSYPSLKTDLKNAGATWVDEEVHVDNGLVSSRTPKDLDAFNEKLVEEFAEGEH